MPRDHRERPCLDALDNTVEVPAHSQHQLWDLWVRTSLNDCSPHQGIMPSLEVFLAETPDMVEQRRPLPTVLCTNSYTTESKSKMKWFFLCCLALGWFALHLECGYSQHDPFFLLSALTLGAEQSGSGRNLTTTSESMTLALTLSSCWTNTHHYLSPDLLEWEKNQYTLVCLCCYKPDCLLLIVRSTPDSHKWPLLVRFGGFMGDKIRL